MQRSADPLPITELLNRSRDGDAVSRAIVWGSIYTHARKIARRACAKDYSSADIQPTLVVHEAYLKLFGSTAPSARWENRRHFWGALSRAIGQVLVDLSRARRSRRRGGQMTRRDLGELSDQLAMGESSPPTATAELVAALDALETASPECAHVARMRFLAGLTTEETAQVLGVAPRTVGNRWRYAKAWLRRALGSASERIDQHGNSVRPTS